MRILPNHQLAQAERAHGAAQNAIRARRYAAEILDIIYLTITDSRLTPTIVARNLNDLGA